ncbi:MAG TPA: ATPase, T2SS/T4P/T4SS family, partial [Noviherbaspirillum sp.]
MRPGASKVQQLEFSELYLGHHGLGDRFCDSAGACIDFTVYDDALHRDLRMLEATCRQAWNSEKGRNGFIMHYDGDSYRVIVMTTNSGEIFILRRLASAVATLRSLGMPPAYVRKLMRADLSGLLVVSGPVNSGKTTTACALVRERLLQYGGVAMTVEDPVELPLEGSHGAGVCFQSNITPESGGYLEAFRTVSRLRPKVIFLGDLRDSDLVREVLEASANGALVISTLQASNLTRAAERLYAHIQEWVNPAAAKSLLAEGLLGIIHQHMIGNQRKSIETQFLFLQESPSAKANLLRGD